MAVLYFFGVNITLAEGASHMQFSAYYINNNMVVVGVFYLV